MTNKNENVINDIEVNIFKYEISKIKSTWSKVFLITIVIQVLSFIFFSVVGKFDGSSDTISSFQGIISLSNTVSMCGISIYGAVLLRKELVKFYIGDQRNRIFLFPVDRKDLLMKKTSSFFTIVLTSFGSALVVSFIIEIVLNLFLKFDSPNIVFEMYLGFVVIATSCSLLYLILILSEIISIWKQSEISTVITAVIFMLMFSNFSAMGLMNFPTVTFVSSVMMGLLLAWIFVEFSKTLNTMEVY